jgi:hypothetical protein
MNPRHGLQEEPRTGPSVELAAAGTTVVGSWPQVEPCRAHPRLPGRERLREDEHGGEAAWRGCRGGDAAGVGSGVRGTEEKEATV